MKREKKLNILSWFVAILVVNNIVIFTPNFGAPYYLFMLFALLFCILQSGIKGFDMGMIFMYFCCIFSILCNDIPSFFKPWGRYASFLLMTMLVSPFLKSEFLYDFRITTFTIIQKLLDFVVIASILAYFGGFAYNMGYFAGITSHSQLMAPIAVCAMLRGIYTLTTKNFQDSKLEKYYYICLILCSLICILLAASRTAIIAAILSVLTYFIMPNKRHLSKIIKYLCAAVAALALSFPIWSPYIDVVVNKNEGSIAAGGIASSRDNHWKNRIKEFKSSPFIGIGFSVVSIDDTDGSTFDMESGGVETGSSWLSALSMLGIFGFGILAILFISSLRKFKILSKTAPKYSAYLFSLLLFWIIHMMAEGYIWGAGGFLFFNVWLMLGCADAISQKKYVISNECQY